METKNALKKKAERMGAAYFFLDAVFCHGVPMVSSEEQGMWRTQENHYL